MSKYELVSLRSVCVENQNQDFNDSTNSLIDALEAGNITHDLLFTICRDGKTNGTSIEFGFDPEEIVKTPSFYQRYWPIPEGLASANKPVSLFLPRSSMFIYPRDDGTSPCHRNLGLFFWHVKREVPVESQQLEDPMSKLDDFCEGLFIVRESN